MHTHRRWGHRLVDRRGTRSAFRVQCHRCRDQSWTPKHSFWSRCGQIGVRIRRHSWPPLVTKARFWVS